MNRKLSILILGIGLFCRFSIALSRADMIWPDEQFQTLEPASEIVFGHSYLAWEWVRGYRSWLLPVFFTPILVAAKVLGLKSGLSLIHFTRAAMAVVDITAWALLVRILRKMNFRSTTQLLVLLLSAFLPALQLWGVTTLQDHMAMILMVLALSVAHESARLSGSPFRRLIAGFLLGSLGWIKIQLGLFSAGWVLASALNEGRAKQSIVAGFKGGLPWILGGVIALLFLGLVDLATLGGFAKSTLNQLTQGESLSRFYGTSPWTVGLAKLIDLLGALPWVLLAFAIPIRFLMAPSSAETLRISVPVRPILAGALLYTAAHLGIPHKETRFFLPMAPAIFIWIAWAWNPLLGRMEDKIGPSVRTLSGGRQLALLMGFALGIGTLGAIGFGIAQETPNYLSSTDVSDLEEVISKIRPNLQNPEKICILLAGHHFSWTRGALILGADVDYRDWAASSENLDSHSPACELAIAGITKTETFIQENPDFALLKKGRAAFVLLARKSLINRLHHLTEFQTN